MKQNLYDHPEFFAGYQALRDSKGGLNEVLEQPAMKSLLSDRVQHDIRPQEVSRQSGDHDSGPDTRNTVGGAEIPSRKAPSGTVPFFFRG
ncbi:MAG: hypothetical protein GY866_18480 [Proteobacteria bacterium]|nr:hypothetical protein [Pseudomonadota bacterium]